MVDLRYESIIELSLYFLIVCHAKFGEGKILLKQLILLSFFQKLSLEHLLPIIPDAMYRMIYRTQEIDTKYSK